MVSCVCEGDQLILLAFSKSSSLRRVNHSATLPIVEISKIDVSYHDRKMNLPPLKG
jgi:hypothetical protein